MTRFANVLWWLLFTCFGLVVEMYVPKLDAFVSGVVLLLQERAYTTMLWLMPVFVLLQEGLGTRTFGGSLVWYVVICLFFRIGERFFETTTFLFVFCISVTIGCAYYGISMLLAPLEELILDQQQLFDVSFMQTIYVALSWLILKRLRRKVEKNDE